MTRRIVASVIAGVGLVRRGYHHPSHMLKNLIRGPYCRQTEDYAMMLGADSSIDVGLLVGSLASAAPLLGVFESPPSYCGPKQGQQPLRSGELASRNVGQTSRRKPVARIRLRHVGHLVCVILPFSHCYLLMVKNQSPLVAQSGTVVLVLKSLEADPRCCNCASRRSSGAVMP
jgi:hypothetical protein